MRINDLYAMGVCWSLILFFDFVCQLRVTCFVVFCFSMTKKHKLQQQLLQLKPLQIPRPKNLNGMFQRRKVGGLQSPNQTVLSDKECPIESARKTDCENQLEDS